MTVPFKDKDFFQDCLGEVQQKMGQRLDPAQFQRDLCAYCRNIRCRRAGWAESKWQHRMMTQEEYLLDKPVFSDLQNSMHKAIHSHEWPDLLRKALKLEISSRNGDWQPVVLPEEDPPSPIVENEENDRPSDGFFEPSSESTTNAIDVALAALTRKKGKPLPKPPRLDLSDPSNPTPPLPQSSRKSKPTPAQAKKLEEVAQFVGVSVEEEAEASQEEVLIPSPPISAPQPESPPSPAAQQQQQQPSHLPMGGNTYIPPEGVMIDGTPVPTPAQMQKLAPKPQPKNDWSPKKKETVVKPHAKIRMGGGNSNE